MFSALSTARQIVRRGDDESIGCFQTLWRTAVCNNPSILLIQHISGIVRVPKCVKISAYLKVAVAKHEAPGVCWFSAPDDRVWDIYQLLSIWMEQAPNEIQRKITLPNIRGAWA